MWKTQQYPTQTPLMKEKIVFIGKTPKSGSYLPAQLPYWRQIFPKEAHFQHWKISREKHGKGEDEDDEDEDDREGKGDSYGTHVCVLRYLFQNPLKGCLSIFGKCITIIRFLPCPGLYPFSMFCWYWTCTNSYSSASILASTSRETSLDSGSEWLEQCLHKHCSMGTSLSMPEEHWLESRV